MKKSWGQIFTLDLVEFLSFLLAPKDFCLFLVKHEISFYQHSQHYNQHPLSLQFPADSSHHIDTVIPSEDLAQCLRTPFSINPPFLPPSLYRLHVLSFPAQLVPISSLQQEGKIGGQTCLLTFLVFFNASCTFSTSPSNLFPSFKYLVMTAGSLLKYSAISCPL